MSGRLSTYHIEADFHMYEELHFYNRPADEAIIWRFVDTKKLVSLIDSTALPFVRPDQFEDKFEGYPPKGNAIHESDLRDIPPEQRAELAIKLSKNVLNLAHMARQIIFVNCWHINEHESASMWKLYLRSDEGVAIRSTFKRLKDSLREAPQKVEIGQVQYIDYETARVETAPIDMLALCMRKRKSFEHERELRAIHWDSTESMEIIHKERTHNSKQIILIPICLDTLIEKVFVAPTSPPSYMDLTKSELERFGIDKPVQQSRLAEDPIW
jgi:hypothetical protein